MGALVGGILCCLYLPSLCGLGYVVVLFFLKSLYLGAGQYTYLILDLLIRLFQYIKILDHSLLSFILCTLFCTDAPLPGGAAFMYAGPDRRLSRPPQQQD